MSGSSMVMLASNSAILLNSPALHSLKRNQLCKLAKRHGVKASGKNEDIVERLKEVGRRLPDDATAYETMPTPSSCSESEQDPDDDDADRTQMGNQPSSPSKAWEEENTLSGPPPLPSWARSTTTFPLAEFGAVPTASGSAHSVYSKKSLAVSTSLKSLASSIKSKVSSRSNHTEPEDIIAVPYTSTTSLSLPEELPRGLSDEDMEVELPGSFSGGDVAASASLASLASYPSTVRLVFSSSSQNGDSYPSPPRLRPFSPVPVDGVDEDEDMSLDELRPVTQFDDPIDVPLHTSSIYPSLPDAYLAQSRNQPTPPRTTPEPFIFGSPVHGVSNSAMANVMSEMNKRLQANGAPVFDRSRAPLVSTAGRIFEGLLGGKEKTRFDGAHDKAFGQMASIVDVYTRKTSSSKPGPSAKPPSKTSSAAMNRVTQLGAKHADGGKGGILASAKKAKKSRMSDVHAKTRGKVISVLVEKEVVSSSDALVDTTRTTATAVIPDGTKTPRPLSPAADAAEDNDASDADGDDGHEVVEVKDREAVRRRLAVARERRRSSTGGARADLAGRRSAMPPSAKKATSGKPGFIQSVKNMWNRAVSSKNTAPSSSNPAPAAKSVASSATAATAASAARAKPTTITKKDIFSKLGSSKPSTVVAAATRKTSASAPVVVAAKKPTLAGKGPETRKVPGPGGVAETRQASGVVGETRKVSGSVARGATPSLRRTTPTPSMSLTTASSSARPTASSSAKGLVSSTDAKPSGISQHPVQPTGKPRKSMHIPNLSSTINDGPASVTSPITYLADPARRPLSPSYIPHPKRPVSTLLAPTASSLARMKENMSPKSGSRPLPLSVLMDKAASREVARESTSITAAPPAKEEGEKATMEDVTNIAAASPLKGKAPASPEKPLMTLHLGGGTTDVNSTPDVDNTAMLADEQGVLPKSVTEGDERKMGSSGRRPRISRAQVIAKLSAQRQVQAETEVAAAPAAGGSSAAVSSAAGGSQVKRSVGPRRSLVPVATARISVVPRKTIAAPGHNTASPRKGSHLTGGGTPRKSQIAVRAKARKSTVIGGSGAGAGDGGSVLAAAKRRVRQSEAAIRKGRLRSPKEDVEMDMD